MIDIKTFSHYLKPINECEPLAVLNFGSRQDDSFPLIVNCAGYVNANYNHTNINPTGRLDYYLIYLVSGSIKFYTDDRELTLSPGSLLVYPPSTPYKYSCDASRENVQFFWAHFTGGEAKSTLERYSIGLFPTIYKISANNHIDARCKGMFDAFANNDSFRKDELSAHLSRLLIEIGRVISITGTGIGRLHKSVRYINEHFSEPIKITELAEMENMCMTTYNLHFKKYVGTPPTRYIIRLRTQLAIELLLNSELSIQEIASRCGYNDYNLFTKVFKSELGSAPTKYRKSFKQKT